MVSLRVLIGFMEVYGCLWVSGCLWVPMGVYKFLWVFMGVYELSHCALVWAVVTCAFNAAER